MPTRISPFDGFELTVEVSAELKILWHAVSDLPPDDPDFESRMQRGARPREWGREGGRGREDACRYAAISCWDEGWRAEAEAIQANEASMANGRGVRFRFVVPVAVEGDLGHAWSEDLEPPDAFPEGHHSVWGEPWHLKSASILDEALPIT